MSEHIIRAIDVGYGHTKLTMSNTGSNITTRSIPSIAIQSSNISELESSLSKRDTQIITVDGQTFEVGKDTKLFADQNHQNLVHDEFTTTPEYKALVYKALFDINQPAIDILVMGLPLSLFHQYKSSIEDTFVGHHKIDNIFSVEVKQVVVLPQPYGALVFNTYLNQEVNFNNKRTLTIDVGNRTVDWYVSQDNKIDYARSGSHNGGMHYLLSSLADAISNDQSLGLKHERITNLIPIDEALRGAEYRIFGQPINIIQYIQNASPCFHQLFNAIKKKVQSVKDIDHIYIVGGGAFFYQEVFREFFPRHHIDAITDQKKSMFANVIGFQLTGEKIAASNALEVKA